MNIKNYSLKNEGNKYITKNFQVKEMRSKDGADTIKIDYAIVCIAQFLRDTFNAPVYINSAFRTVSHNKSVGGKTNSKHLISCALDLYIKGQTSQTLADVCYSLGLVRVGVYSNFIHIDTDRTPIWLSQGNFTKVNIPYKKLLLLGKTDYLIAIVQYKLNCLGYSCGKEDGIFGILTLNAVKTFQKVKGLTVDGKVGINTWNALFNS